MILICKSSFELYNFQLLRSDLSPTCFVYSLYPFISTTTNRGARHLPLRRPFSSRKVVLPSVLRTRDPEHAQAKPRFSRAATSE